jgi:hypothetical protein
VPGAGPLVQHVMDEVLADQLGALAGGVDHGNAFVPEDEVAEFVSEGPVPGGQPLLDEKDVVVAVLPPLAANTRR